MSLGHYGAEKGMSDIEIFSLLIDADDRWGKFKNRTDRIKRLSDIINIARQKHPHAITDYTFDGLRADDEIESETRYFYKFMDFVNADFRMEWLVNGLFTAQSVGIIASGPGVGKSQMCLQLGTNFALGRKLLRYEPTRQLRTGFFSLEMGGPALQLFTNEAVKQFSDSERETISNHFSIAPIGEPVNLTKPAGQKFLESFIQENDLDILFIDSFGKIISGEIEKDVPVREVFNYLHRVKRKFNCAIFIVHHNRKATGNNKKPVDISDVYGSQYITSEADLVITLWRDVSNGPIEWREVKNRFAPEREPFLFERREYLSFNYLADLSDKSVVPDRRRSDRINGAISDDDSFLGFG
jgi:predicted ATP-dependent serine protease